MKGGDLNGLVEAVRKDIAPAAGNGADRNARNTPPANIVTPERLPETRQPNVSLKIYPTPG